jgi:hypothetical protein
MTGHDQIERMREQRMRPDFIFLNDYPCDTNWTEHADHATVSCHGEDIGLLDLRFVKGCRVSISSLDESRAKALFEKCKYEAASTVAACHVLKDKHPLDQTGWMEIYHG